MGTRPALPGGAGKLWKIYRSSFTLVIMLSDDGWLTCLTLTRTLASMASAAYGQWPGSVVAIDVGSKGVGRVESPAADDVLRWTRLPHMGRRRSDWPKRLKLVGTTGGYVNS